MHSSALIVAPSSPRRQALADVLSATGLFADVRMTADGPTALESTSLRQVAMIFCQQQGLTADSLGWLKSLKKREELSDIPVVVLMEKGGAKERVLALDLGACDCLPTDICDQEMAARIRSHLRQKERMDHLRQVKSDLARLALTDSLTHLYNRAFFDVTLEAELARSVRTGKPFSLMLLDLDHFKKVNDTYGHPQGDRVLQEVAKCLGRTVRRTDTPCRYGGEEFALILPETNAPQAFTLASRIHKSLQAVSAGFSLHGHPITISIGLTCIVGDAAISPQDMVEQADCALYAAKRKGRNRTEMFTPEDAFLDFLPPHASSAGEYAFA
ncbi:diguanylate cyclase [Desulfuromonas sp. AOP6]|uniref:GGDEF domain-containing response regulator n=1 Tax=Desulfuromonas sp. AOP6 TaxID=1566351 RepID=UPI00127CE9EB|nr:diguanylate cyclase [Desulfuromonas sp. AOP6]BCA79152.1 diguanylate cyclase response regulator [Desulfuromonas sp. AOP6]